jgi:hypothetical protein
MDNAKFFAMQQEMYDRQRRQEASLADLKKTYLHKTVKAAAAGMLAKAHRRYENQTGVVGGIIAGPVCGLEINWEDGSTTHSLPYMVTVVDV